MTDDDIRLRFIEIGIARFDVACEPEDADQFNRFYAENEKLEEELRSRPGDRRPVLFDPMKHPNMQLRFNAATALFALYPKEAREALLEIHEKADGPIATGAIAHLDWIDQGKFTPT